MCVKYDEEITYTPHFFERITERHKLDFEVVEYFERKLKDRIYSDNNLLRHKSLFVYSKKYDYGALYTTKGKEFKHIIGRTFYPKGSHPLTRTEEMTFLYVD